MRTGVSSTGPQQSTAVRLSLRALEKAIGSLPWLLACHARLDYVMQTVTAALLLFNTVRYLKWNINCMLANSYKNGMQSVVCNSTGRAGF